MRACAGSSERNGGPPTFEGAPDAINAWVRIYADVAREQAREADERLAREGEERAVASAESRSRSRTCTGSPACR